VRIRWGPIVIDSMARSRRGGPGSCAGGGGQVTRPAVGWGGGRRDERGTRRSSRRSNPTKWTRADELAASISSTWAGRSHSTSSQKQETKSPTATGYSIHANQVTCPAEKMASSVCWANWTIPSSIWLKDAFSSQRNATSYMFPRSKKIQGIQMTERHGTRDRQIHQIGSVDQNRLNSWLWLKCPYTLPSSISGRFE
jgi:hypothetical protein